MNAPLRSSLLLFSHREHSTGGVTERGFLILCHIHIFNGIL